MYEHTTVHVYASQCQVYETTDEVKYTHTHTHTHARAHTQCFGLLGVNGAGKTTTFRMLTGDTHLTDGNALIASNSVQGSLGPTRQSIGYCPQVSAFRPPLIPSWYKNRTV